MIRRSGFGGALVGVVVVAALSGCAFVARVSQPSGNPPPAESNGASAHPSISTTGRYVAFDSTATNLVANDTNGLTDVFVHDFVTRTTVRVSVGVGGVQATGASRNPSISADGQRIAFESDAANLVAADADTTTDVFVHDLAAGTTILASVATDGSPFVRATKRPVLSGNGQSVVFGLDLEAQGFCCVPVPTVRRIDLTTTTVLTSAVFGTVMAITDDGTRLALVATAPGPGDGATFAIRIVDAAGVIVREIASGTISHQSQGYALLTLSGDGSTVAWFLGNRASGQVKVEALGPPVVAPAFTTTVSGMEFLKLSTNGQSLFVRNASTVDGQPVGSLWEAGSTALRVVSTNKNGAISNLYGGQDLSGDGKWVALEVFGAGMIDNDTNGVADIFLRSTGASKVGPTA